MCECPAPMPPQVVVVQSSQASINNMQTTKPQPPALLLGQTLKLVGIGCCLTAITNFPSGFMHTSVNTAVTELNTYLNQSYLERGNSLEERHFTLFRSLIYSCWYAGQILGALGSPYLCDTYGRKPAYLLATGMMTLACALQMLATLFPYPELLILGRVLASVFSPMSDTVAILYLQEISPTRLRGALSSLFATGYSAMGLLGMVLGIRHVLGHSLTLLFFVPVLPGLLSVLFLACIPETPKFLAITKQDHEAARRSLRFYQGECAVTEQAFRTYMLEEAKEEPGEQTSGSLMTLFRVPYLRKALLLSLMAMVPTLAFYPILQSSTFFLLSLHISTSLAQISSSLMMALLTGCCVVAAFLVDAYPRRRLLLGFGVGSLLSLLLFMGSAAVAPHWHWCRFGAVAGMMLYICCYGLAIGPISYFIAPELVPMQHRSSMFCLCFSLISVLIVLTNFATLPLYELIGPIAFGPLFVLPSALSLLYLWLYLPETKGQETHQIVALLKAGGRQRHNSERQILGGGGKA